MVSTDVNRGPKTMKQSDSDRSSANRRFVGAKRSIAESASRTTRKDVFQVANDVSWQLKRFPSSTSDEERRSQMPDQGRQCSSFCSSYDHRCIYPPHPIRFLNGIADVQNNRKDQEGIITHLKRGVFAISPTLAETSLPSIEEWLLCLGRSFRDVGFTA